MSELCPVCNTAYSSNVTKCTVCGFADEFGINRQWLSESDENDWLNSVVKPYRIQWEASKREAIVPSPNKNDKTSAAVRPEGTTTNRNLNRRTVKRPVQSPPPPVRPARITVNEKAKKLSIYILQHYVNDLYEPIVNDKFWELVMNYPEDEITRYTLETIAENNKSYMRKEAFRQLKKLFPHRYIIFQIKFFLKFCLVIAVLVVLFVCFWLFKNTFFNL